MQVLICGYGMMGREVQAVLHQREHTVVACVDPIAADADTKAITPDILKSCDVVIEFSHAAAVVDHARLYAEHQVRAIVGTTGWDTSLLKDIEECSHPSFAYLYGSNFSVGAHILFAFARYAGSILNGLPEYDVAVSELHHRKKVDSPSGTALTIAQCIMDNLESKTNIDGNAMKGAIDPSTLHVSSTRVGTMHGTHTIFLDSVPDSIEITHRARNRSGFALGAVLAAEWIADKQGIFTVEDFMASLLQGNEKQK